MGSPLEVAHGLAFQTLAKTGPNRYLNCSPGAAVYDLSISVYMTDVLDYNKNRGCFWKIILGNNFCLHFKTQADTSEARYLDSDPGVAKERTVFLSSSTVGGGSYWTCNILPDPSYSLLCHSPNGKQYLTADPIASKKESVFLSKTTDCIGTHWTTLAASYAADKIEHIIHAVFSDVPINSYESGAIYASLDYDCLYTIWNDSQLGDDKSCDDYPVHLKSEVSKRPNTYNLPDVKGSLCGIMWGTIENKSIAINFTIDPFVKLILFDPQNGQQIPIDVFTPTFCMM